MVIVVRYMVLLALGFASVLAFMSAVMATGQLLVAKNIHSVLDNGYTAFIIGAVVAMALWLFVRQVTRTYVLEHSKEWLAKNKENFLTFGLVAGFCLVFLVL